MSEKQAPQIVEAKGAELRTPPSAWYTDAGHAGAEARLVFGRNWIPMACISELAEEGQYTTHNLAGEPLVLVRSESGIKGFFNVCRHHAAQVATGASGCVKRLQCPYHGWTYSLDGALEVAPLMEGVEGFEKSAYRLPEIRVEAWQNWVWVCLDDRSPDLASALGGFYDEISEFDLAGLQFFARREYPIACNWKVFVDNYLDGGYHVPFIHKGLTTVLDNRDYRIDVGERSVLQSAPVVPSDSAAGQVRTGDRARYWWLHPNFMINLYEGVMDTHLVLPDGPEHCRVICDYFFADCSKEAQERNEESVRVAHEIQLEDVEISESVQRGLRSRSYDTGPLNPNRELGEALFQDILKRDLEGADL